MRHWKRAIEIAVEMGVDTMNSEFGRGPHPDKGTCYCCHTGSMIEACEDAWWRSMEELVPIFEKEGINLHIEPHPEDWTETLQPVGRPDPHGQQQAGQVPLLHPAHLLLRRRHGGDAARMRRRARACPHRRHLQPQGQLRPALHHQPAGLDGAGAPAPQHRPGRGAVGRLLPHPARGRLRRHHDRLRLRLGREGGRVRQLHARARCSATSTSTGGRNEPPGRCHRDGDDRPGPHPPPHPGALRGRGRRGQRHRPRPRRGRGARGRRGLRHARGADRARTGCRRW